MPGMVSLSSEWMASLAQVVIFAFLALESNAFDGVHADIAKNIGVDSRL